MKKLRLGLFILLILTVFCVSCSSQNTTQSPESNFNSSMGEVHNILLDRYLSQPYAFKGDLFNENGLMPFANYNVMMNSFCEYFKELGYQSSYIDSLREVIDEQFQLMGVFKTINGQKFLLPFDSTFVINSYNYCQNVEILTEEEKELMAPIIMKYVDGADPSEIDYEILLANQKIHSFDTAHVEKMYDFLSVYSASKNYWASYDLIGTTYAGASTADAIGTYVGHIAGTWIGAIVGTGIGGPIGGAVGGAAGYDAGGAIVSAGYSAMYVAWHNYKMNH